MQGRANLEQLSEHLRGHRPAQPKLPPGCAEASVALLALEAAGGLELLFIERAQRPGDPWSGHIAFPGGRRESTDPDLCATALREAREEVGFEPGPCLGHLGDFRPALRELRVGAYVFGVASRPRLVPSAEVSSGVWIPLGVLSDPAARLPYRVTHPETGETRDVPALRHGSYLIWGLTLRIADVLLELLKLDRSLREPA